MKYGLFITFEGGEGAGKSIQVEILASHLREEGFTVQVTREPGGTRIGEQIRAITHDPENVDLDPIAEAYLMAASRAQHVSEIIFPSMEMGKIVLCDRYVDSSIAYQGYGRKLGEENIRQLNSYAVNGAKPDVTIFMNIAPEKGIARRNHGQKQKDRLDLQQQDFYDRVYKGYVHLAEAEPERFITIDASRSIEKVAEEIWQRIHAILKSRKVAKVDS